MTVRGAKNSEHAKAWRVARLGGVELLHAQYVRQNFSRHFHRRYALGVMEKGAMRFNYLGQSHVATCGKISLCIPAETHDGQAAGREGWQYRMFYLEPSLMRAAASEVAGRPQDFPYFKSGVIADPDLAGQIWALHTALESGGMTDLEMQARLLGILGRLIQRHADHRPRSLPAGGQPKALARAREYLEANFRQNPSLDDLSREAGLSRYHLLRSFKKQYGLPPHAYLNLLKVNETKRLMARGLALADIAHGVGFVDQSHMNRTFKKLLGITPGQFSNSLQDAAS